MIVFNNSKKKKKTLQVSKNEICGDNPNFTFTIEFPLQVTYIFKTKIKFSHNFEKTGWVSRNTINFNSEDKELQLLVEPCFDDKSKCAQRKIP